MRTHLLAGLGAGLILVLMVACDGGSAGPSNGQPDTTHAPPTQGQGPVTGIGECTAEAVEGATQVSMVDPHSFDPAEVTISSGDTVTWTNESSNNHTVSFEGSSIDCGYILIGKSASITFSEPGTYTYYDRILGNTMSGKVIVQ